MATDRYKATNDYRNGRQATNKDRKMSNMLSLQQKRAEDNKLAREILIELAANPLVRPEVKRIITELWLPHLNSSPTAILNWKVIRVVSTMAKLAAAMRAGKIAPRALGPEGWSVETEREYHAKRKAMIIAGRPEWMNDPTVLPKRPPSK